MDRDRAEIIKLIMETLEETVELNTFRRAREIFHKVFLPATSRLQMEFELLNKVKKRPKSRSN